jgi:hypothetical protein
MRPHPDTCDARPEAGTSSVRLGMRLFLASEAMCFGSLLSEHVLPTAGAAKRPDAGVLGVGRDRPIDRGDSPAGVTSIRSER